MPEVDMITELRSVLVEASKSGKTVRFFGPTGNVIAEGKVASVGENIVALKQRDRDDPNEYILISCLTRIQFVPETRTF